MSRGPGKCHLLDRSRGAGVWLRPAFPHFNQRAEVPLKGAAAVSQERTVSLVPTRPSEQLCLGASLLPSRRHSSLSSSARQLTDAELSKVLQGSGTGLCMVASQACEGEARPLTLLPGMCQAPRRAPEAMEPRAGRGPRKGLCRQSAGKGAPRRGSGAQCGVEPSGTARRGHGRDRAGGGTRSPA